MTTAKEFALASHNVHFALLSTLHLTVPFWIRDLGGLTDDQRSARANRCGRIVAEHGDVLMFGTKKRGQVTEVFNALAEGIACAAYQPGGITFAGHHWCTDHQECLDAAADVARGRDRRVAALAERLRTTEPGRRGRPVEDAEGF